MSRSSPPPAASSGGWRRTLRTAAHIPPSQLLARLRILRRRKRYARDPSRPIVAARERSAAASERTPLPQLPSAVLVPEGLDVVSARAVELRAGRFTYLGKTLEFAHGVDWIPEAASPLWQYQLQYLTCVRDLALTGNVDGARDLLGSWIDTHGDLWNAVAWHPYPVSLRLANVCHAAQAAGGFAALHPRALELVGTHAAYLLEHLEHDVRGNHLFENARALVHASAYLDGPFAETCGRVAREILAVEIPEQVLGDGGHFELSPLYHTIVLHGVLQIEALLDRRSAAPLLAVLRAARERMVRFLAAVLCPDGDIPLTGDSVRGFGPPPGALIDIVTATDAAVPPSPQKRFTALADSGLYVWRGLRTFAVLDAGPICPSYLPAHGQADSLSVEVWVDQVCVVADPGVFDYTGVERAWGRSSRAHSTITVDDADHAEVYGSFRVGGRPVLETPLLQGESVTAALRPYGSSARLVRTVRWGEQPGAVLRILDRATAPVSAVVRSRLHLAPGVQLSLSDDRRTAHLTTTAGAVDISAEHPLSTEDGRVSPRFGERRETTILVQELAAGGAAERSGWFRIEPAPRDDGA